MRSFIISLFEKPRTAFAQQRMRLTPGAISAAIGILSIFCLPSQAADVDKGKQTIAAAVAALGGYDFLTMKNRVETGRVYSFYRERLTGLAVATVYTEYLAQKPASGVAVRERQSFGKKKEEFSILFLENEGYEITFRGARPLPDDRTKRYFSSVQNNIIYILRTRHNDPSLHFDYVASDVVNNHPVDIVDVSDDESLRVRVFFSQSTHLPVRQLVTRFNSTSRDRDEEITEYAKYRDGGHGVTLPQAIRRDRNGERVYELYADKLEVNRDLPPNIFAVGQGIKLLKKID